MARFLSPEWVAAFNEAIEGVDLTDLVAPESLLAASGSYQVEQMVHDVPPDATVVRTVLVVEPDSVVLHLRDEVPHANGGVRSTEALRDSDVTISLDYSDAAAMSKGVLTPAHALASGRVRVRGDLSVLIAGQSLLFALADRLKDLQASTTY